jgi:hypothetical protein
MLRAREPMEWAVHCLEVPSLREPQVLVEEVGTIAVSCKNGDRSPNSAPRLP